MAEKPEETANSSTKIDPIELESRGLVREVGSQAVWSLSSCKPGKIRD